MSDLPPYAHRRNNLVLLLGLWPVPCIRNGALYPKMRPCRGKWQVHPNSQTGGQALKELFTLLQWPAMVATLVAAWLVASQAKRKRSWGFWWFLVSNVLWVVWGWYDHAYALIALQLGLFALNLRGAWKNEPQRNPPGNSSS